MIKYTTGFVDKLEAILEESTYTVRYERGNFQSGWCLLDHKRVVVLNKFLNTEGRVNTLVDLIPQLKIDYDKLTLNSQKLFDFLTENRLEKLGIESPGNVTQEENAPAEEPNNAAEPATKAEPPATTEPSGETPEDQQGPTDTESNVENDVEEDAENETKRDHDADLASENG